MKSDLNSHILKVINSTIEEKILPSIENVFTNNREAKNTNRGLRSDGRHPDRNIQMTPNLDPESHGRHKNKFCQQVQVSGENFPKLIATCSNQNNHHRENLVDFKQSDDDGYDTDDPESRKQFLANFDWADSTLNSAEVVQIVEFHDIFASHRFDIVMNEDFKVTLTPKYDSPASSQSLPTPINLKGDILVELALLHRYGIITTLPFSKYASPIFAQKKPNGKLRLLVDLRKINNLISDDYINNNHPVSTLTDAAQHMAGKQLLCKLDCSQAYHCLQMAD